MLRTKIPHKYLLATTVTPELWTGFSRMCLSADKAKYKSLGVFSFLYVTKTLIFTLLSLPMAPRGLARCSVFLGVSIQKPADTGTTKYTRDAVTKQIFDRPRISSEQIELSLDAPQKMATTRVCHLGNESSHRCRLGPINKPRFQVATRPPPWRLKSLSSVVRSFTSNCRKRSSVLQKCRNGLQRRKPPSSEIPDAVSKVRRVALS